MLASSPQMPTALLEETELFRPLESRERAYLAEKMYHRAFERGQLLVTQGVPLEEIFIVSSGLVSVVQEDESGGQTEVAQLGKGALLGEMSLLTGNLPNAHVIAMLDTEVWALSHFDFQVLLSRSIPLALSVNRSLSAKLAATTQRLTPRRTAHLTAIIGDRGHPTAARLSLDLAASIAHHTRSRVLLIDAFPLRDSPLIQEPTWGESVEQLLQNPAQIVLHARPALPSDPHGNVRLIRYSANEQGHADPGALLSLITRLRGLYRHILIDLPHDHQGLLEDTLSFMERVVVVSHRNRLHKLNDLLTLPEVAAARERGLLAVTGWPHRFSMGEVWGVEQHHHHWKVAALVDENNPQDGVDRLARHIARMRVGLAWGAGNSRGWALAGIVRTLEQLKVPMDVFAGTSAGALGAAVYGLEMDYRAAEQLMQKVLPYLKRSTSYFPPITISRHSLYAESFWNSLIKTMVGDKTFDDMLVPFAAVALDMKTGNQHTFERGLLWRAVRASASVPVVAPPMVVEGRVYSDGGVVNSVPLDVVRNMGADILIGIDLAGREQEEAWGDTTKPNMLATVLRVLNVAFNTSASRTLPLAHALIRPALRASTLYDVSVMDEFMQEGERSTLEVLPDLKKAMPWLE